jgi:hypothetical protein
MSKYYSRVKDILKKALEGKPSRLLFVELYSALEKAEPTINVRKKLETIWIREIEEEHILKTNKGVTSFTLASIRPQLRDELDRRIMASASLIKLNKQRAVETTMQRFEGWMSSLPAVPEVRREQTDGLADEARKIVKPLRQLPFEERRVAIDQGHKLIANLNQIVAYDGGAIGAYWHSHWRELNYDYREDHKELDKEFFLIQDSQAIRDGLVKKGGHKYIEELEDQPGEEVYCRCYFEYIYRLNRVPEECLTQKGKETIRAV